MDMYAVVSATAKGKCMRKEEVKTPSNIDPETFDYEIEKDILNCYPSLAMAKWVQRNVGKNRMTAIIGLCVADGRVACNWVSRNRERKLDIAVSLGQKYNTCNYCRAFNYQGRELKYLVLYGVSDIVAVFDPFEHPVSVEPGIRGNTPGPVVQAPQVLPPQVPPPREEPRPMIGEAGMQQEGSWWESRWMAFLGGLLAGLVLGLVITGFVDRHRIVAVALLLTGLTLMMLWIIYKISGKEW